MFEVGGGSVGGEDGGGEGGGGVGTRLGLVEIGRASCRERV